MSAGRYSSASTPMLGVRCFISAMTASPGLRSAPMKSFGVYAATASSSWSPRIDLDRRRGRGDRQLVHAVRGVKDDGPLHPEALQNVRHLARQRRVGDAEGLVSGARRVAQRAEDVEHGAQPKVLARHGREAKRRVKDRGEEKADARLVDAARHASRREVDLHAQLLEHVGRAAQGRGGAVAVLGDPRAARGGDDRRERRDVEGGQAVAAGSARIEERTLDLDRGCHRPRGPREARDLLRGLALHAQRDEEARDLRRRRVAANDDLESGGGLVLGEVLALDELGKSLDHSETFSLRLTKFPRIFLPSLVSTDSGWNCTP